MRVPNGVLAHDHPNTGRTLYRMSYKESEGSLGCSSVVRASVRCSEGRGFKPFWHTIVRQFPNNRRPVRNHYLY